MSISLRLFDASAADQLGEADVTLRDAYELHYRDHAVDLADTTEKRYRYEIARWERFTQNPAVGQIDTETIKAFRKAQRAAGLAPDTAESAIRLVLQVLRLLGPAQHGCEHGLGILDQVPYAGKRLQLAEPDPRDIPLAEWGAMYSAAHVAQWPRLGHCSTEDFWRTWLVTSLSTALRLEDQMYRVLWKNLHLTIRSKRLVVKPSKTIKSGKTAVFPVGKMLAAHLELLRGGNDLRVFPVSRSTHLVRRELRRISEAAGISPPVLPQEMRQSAATHWECAQDGAGPKLLGHSLGVSDRYIKIPVVLKLGLKKFRWPKPMRAIVPTPEKAAAAKAAEDDRQLKLF